MASGASILLISSFLASPAACSTPGRLALGGAVAVLLLVLSPALYQHVPSHAIFLSGSFASAAMKVFGYCYEFKQLSSTWAYLADMVVDVVGSRNTTEMRDRAVMTVAPDHIDAAQPHTSRQLLPPPPTAQHSLTRRITTPAAAAAATAATVCKPGLVTSSNNGVVSGAHAAGRRPSPRFRTAVHRVSVACCQLALLDMVLVLLRYLRLDADVAQGILSQQDADVESQWAGRLWALVLPGTAGWAEMAAQIPLPPDFVEQRLHCCLFGAALYLQICAAYEFVMALVVLCFPAIHDAAPPLFNSPWLATSLHDLWSHRWHQMFRGDLVRLAYKPMRRLCTSHLCSPRRLVPPAGPTGTGWSDKRWPPWSGAVQRALPVLAVFLLSGLVHEYMMWGAFGARHVDGRQLAFFMLHGVAVVAEGVAHSCCPPRWRAAVPHAVRHAAVVLFVLATADLFMGPWIAAGFHRHFPHPVQVLRLLVPQS